MAKRSKKKKQPPDVKASQIAIVEPKEIPSAKEISRRKLPSLNWKIICQALVIAASVHWIYWPALRGDWLWDDDLYITENPLLHNPARLWKAWFEPGSFIEYYPLQETVQWVQWKLWGMDTLGYHVTNVFLHIISALLVWRLLSKFGLPLAWLGGLIFAIHPVQVESVAWIAELKNTLSLPPFLLAMCAWIDFEERGKVKDYWLALGLFLIAMLCKITMAPFPLVILLYAWWKRGRIACRDVGTSLPFWLISLLLGFTAIWTGQIYESHGYTGPNEVLLGGILSRLDCAGLSLSFYFSKCFLPLHLLPIYPQWIVDPSSLAQFLPWFVLGGIGYWLWTKRLGWGRHALLGLGFFLLFLAPFLGLKAISYMGFTWAMDHFLYLPIIGLIGLVVAALGQLQIQLPAFLRPYGIGLVTALIVLMAFGSHSYAKIYINEQTLWTYDLHYDTDSPTVYNNLGCAFFKTGQVSEAIENFEEALRINPGHIDAHTNMGGALLHSGHLTEAIEQYQQALQIKPSNAELHANLGNALVKAGRLSEAMEQFNQAVNIQPEIAETHDGLGVALIQARRLPEAIGQLEQAVQIDPDDVKAHNNFGLALLQTGRVGEAIEQYNQALHLEPDDAETHNNLGLALFQSGRIQEATEQYEEALRINPDDAGGHYNLANALLRTGAILEAIKQYRQALRHKPDFAEAHSNLGNVLFQTGQLPEAIQQYQHALETKPDNAGTHYNLGSALQQTGNFSEAIKQYEEALRLKPDFAAALSSLAKLQALQKAAPAKN